MGYGMGPYAGADYKLTLSHCRLQNPAFNPNDDECRRMLPQILQNGTTNRKRESTKKGEGRGGGTDLMSYNRPLWGAWATPCLS